MTPTAYLASPKKQVFIGCGNCNSQIYFFPKIPLMKDDAGSYCFITPQGTTQKLPVTDWDTSKSIEISPSEPLPPVASIKCPKCLTYSTLVATHILIQSEAHEITLVQDENGVSEMPVALLQELKDGKFLLICIMRRFEKI
jgi:hypothetical protein